MKKFRFFYTSPSGKKYYHISSSCQISDDPLEAKLYTLNENALNEQVNLIRNNFTRIWSSDTQSIKTVWGCTSIDQITVGHEEVSNDTVDRGTIIVARVADIIALFP